MTANRIGKTFERKIANYLRDLFPDAVFARSLQAEQAHQSDVYCVEGPDRLKRAWFECNDAQKPNPTTKLEQAERDIGERAMLPIVVWHRRNAKAINVTTRLWVPALLTGGPALSNGPRLAELTFDLDTFAKLLLAPWVAAGD